MTGSRIINSFRHVSAVDIFTRRQLGVVRVFTARLLKFSIFLPKFLAAGYKQYVLMAGWLKRVIKYDFSTRTCRDFGSTGNT